MNLRTLTVVLASLVLAASCTSGSEGIFASIEREQKIVDAGNFNNASTVTHMAEFSGSYYAAGGRALFSRSVGGTKWDSTVSLNGASPRNYEAVGVGGGGKLFVLVNSGASASNRLYSFDGTTWADVTPPSFTPTALVPVRQTDGVSSNELVVTGSDYATVVLISGGSVGSLVSLGVGAGGTAITAAVKSGTDYYLVNDSFVVHLPGFASPALVTGLPSGATYGHGYRGLIITSGLGVPNGAYLSTAHGYIFHGALSGATWTPDASVPVVANQSKTSGGDTVSYDQFLYNAHTPCLWVGTGSAISAEGYGYAAINTSLGLSFLPPDGTGANNYTSSKLGSYRTPLLFQASNGTEYLGTWSHGLWVWDPAGLKWSQE